MGWFKRNKPQVPLPTTKWERASCACNEQIRGGEDICICPNTKVVEAGTMWICKDCEKGVHSFL